MTTYVVSTWNAGLSENRTRYAVINRRTGQRYWTYATRAKANAAARYLNLKG